MKTKTKKVHTRKQRKTRFHRKNRKLQQIFSILEKNRQKSQSMMVGGGLFGLSKEEKAAKAKEAKDANVKAISTLQGKDNFNKTQSTDKKTQSTDTTQTDDTKTPEPTDAQKLVAHKDLNSVFEKSQEAKLTKEMEYQRTYNNYTSGAALDGRLALGFMAANATVGLLAASGVGLPAAGGIAVCMLIISKIMKKFKELKELQIIMLDMNLILTNCYYLENMINKMLTIFQIYINDMTDDKKYFRKIITVEDYITNLNTSCKNIKQLVEENNNSKASVETNNSAETNQNSNNTKNNSKYSEFKKKTKKLKGYNLGERIQNAKQLYINNNNNIDEVIKAETAEYTAFETALELNNDNIKINIDDDDALESLMKFMVYQRIKHVLENCPKNKVENSVKNSDAFNNVAISQISNTNNNNLKGGSGSGSGSGSNEKMYDKESKYIYQIGVNPDIKFRIKQKLNIIRDLLIEIDPTSAQDTMKSVELNESLEKVEEDAFKILPNKNELESVIHYTIPIKKIINNDYKKDCNLTYSTDNNNIITETDFNNEVLKNYNDVLTLTKVVEINNKKILNEILNYWLRIKQYSEDKDNKDTAKPNKKLNDFLLLHKQEWTQFLKKCFLKIEYYKSYKDNNKNKKPEKNDEKIQSYANYESWVRYYLKTNKKNKRGITGQIFGSMFNKDDGVANVTNFLSAKDKTNMLMNTMNLLNAMFIIMNSQFVATIKEYEKVLTTDTYTDKDNTVNGLDRILQLCRSTVAYKKFLLPPDFNEDEKAILDQVEVSDLTNTMDQTDTIDTKENDDANTKPDDVRSASPTTSKI